MKIVVMFIIGIGILAVWHYRNTHWEKLNPSVSDTLDYCTQIFNNWGWKQDLYSLPLEEIDEEYEYCYNAITDLCKLHRIPSKYYEESLNTLYENYTELIYKAEVAKKALEDVRHIKQRFETW